MKKYIKAINFILTIVLIAGTIAGCKTTTNKNTANKGNQQGTQKVIQIFIPGYADALWKSLYDSPINDFQNENKDIRVEVIPAGWDEANSKIIGLIQAGQAPDIMITGSRSLRQFAELGAIEPLDRFITDKLKAERVQTVLNTANIKGVQYGIPLAFSSRALYYRTDLIDNPPTTWDELLQTAKKVKNDNPSMYGFAIPTDITGGTDELFNFIYQNGGSATDKEGNIKLATPENIETLDFLKKFNDKKLIPDPVATSRSSQAPMFQNGNLAMFISGPWEKKKLEESKSTAPYGVALLPAGKKRAETLVTDSFSISSQSENKELAWKLIEYMGQFKYQNVYDETIGFFPILKEEEKQPRYKDEFLKPFGDMVQYGIPEPQVPVWDTFNAEFVGAVQRVMTGDATAKQALKDAEIELTK